MSNIIDSIQLSGVTYTLSAQTGGGEGKSVEAGRGIDVASGTSAYTVSFNLPISAGTGSNSIAEGGTGAGGNYSHAEGYGALANGNYSHAEGNYTLASGQYSHAEGYLTTASGQYSHAEGNDTIANNQSEHASGQYNVSNKANNTFGNSGNTLFSVGNGTSYNARHNAFEIRQNGDIYLTKDGQDVKLQDQLGGGTVDQTIISGSTNAVAGGAVYSKIDEVEEVTARELDELNDAISGKVDTSTYNAYTAATDTALSGKQDTLSAGTNITIVDNVISAEGGGKSVEAGRGISVASGTSAYTVSFNLPISAGTGTRSIIEGSDTTASGDYSHAEGYITKASGDCSHAEGYNTKTSGNFGSHAEGFITEANGDVSHAEGNHTTANGDCSHTEGKDTRTYNHAEHASGAYNVSSSASATFGDSGNTLFSVGNGTSESARHNAFEIRQNGDIYITSGGTDIKLQDHLGGGGGTVDQTIISGSTNAVAGGAVYSKIDEVEQVTAAALNNINDRLSEDEEVTAAGLNAVNDKFDGLKLKKLSQAEYDALTTKDSNTLYIVI